MQSADVSLSRTVPGLDMFQIREVPHSLEGVLGFLMARADGPPTLLRRPAVDCYVLGIGLGVSNIRIDANGRTLRRGVYGMNGVHLVQPNQDADYFFGGRLCNFRLRLSTSAVAQAAEELGVHAAGLELADFGESTDRTIGVLSRRMLRKALIERPDLLAADELMSQLIERVLLLNASRRIKQPSPERMTAIKRRRVIDYMEHHCTREIRLAELCAVAGLSRSHFQRAFKAAIGMPPHAFLTTLRLRTAGRMLATRELGLAEIAVASGFASHAHMTDVFHSIIGFTPSELRDPERHGLSALTKLVAP